MHRLTGVISEGDPKFELKLEGLDGIAVKYYPDVPADAHKPPVMFFPIDFTSQRQTLGS